MYKLTEKDKYILDRHLTCERLGITINDYNLIRNYGRRLHRIYERQCNGYVAMPNYGWDTSAERRDNKIEKSLTLMATTKAAALGLQIYFQTDPRGATIYLSSTPIEDNNYNRKGCECIY